MRIGSYPFKPSEPVPDYFLAENSSTVRKAASVFQISKSTVHKDVSERLKKQNNALYQQVKQVLEQNKQERHIRGGMATREKYEKLKHSGGSF